MKQNTQNSTSLASLLVVSNEPGGHFSLSVGRPASDIQSASRLPFARNRYPSSLSPL